MADELKRQFGSDNVFLDVDSIGPGVKFDDAIRRSINSSSVVLIMIGPKWLSMTCGDGNRRLDDKADHLRVEIETALLSKALVIPVLVDGATMPAARDLPDEIAELTELNAYSLTDSHWSYDIEQLIDKISPGGAKREKETISAPAVVSLVLSAMIVMVFLEDDYDYDTLLGSFAIAVVALVLSVYAYRKSKPKGVTNKAICITGMVLGALLAIVSLSEMGNYEDSDDDFYGHTEIEQRRVWNLLT